MVRVRKGRTWRAVGAAVLVLGISAGPLVGASSAGTLSSFSGKANGYALGVTVDLSTLPAAVLGPIKANYTQIRNALPAQLQAALPVNFTGVVDEKLIETLAQMGVTQNAQSLIGTGTIDLGKLIGGPTGAEATTNGTSHTVTKAMNLPADNLPLVGVAAGVLNASVAKGPQVSSDGTLAQVAASLAALKALFPASLNTAFDQITTAVQSAINTANSSVGSQMTSVATTLKNSTDPTLGPLLNTAGLSSDTTSQLTTALQNALTIPNVNSILTGNAAVMKALHNVAATENLSTGKVTSDASTTLANINVLGLLNVDAVDLVSHSEAAGIAGSAKNTSSCKIADVKLGSTNGVSLDGKTLYVNGVALPTPLANLGAIQNAIATVTTPLGLSATLCDTAQKDASADGTAAAQRVSALRIELAPKAPAAIPALGITAGQTLLKIVVDPTVETSVAARLATVAPTANLPKTGAGALLSVLVGLGLAGTAIFLRRKFA